MGYHSGTGGKTRPRRARGEPGPRVASSEPRGRLQLTTTRDAADWGRPRQGTADVLKMSFYRDRVYPRLVSRLGDPSPIRARRRQLLARARGDVLEIGVGPGVNFVHYDPQRVTKLYALEPNTGMLRLAEEQRRRTDIEVEFLDLPGERIPLDDASIDTVVSTFTLCTIPGVMDAIRGIARVLKRGGRLI